MHLPAFRDHQAERRADQARVCWLSEFVAAAVIALAMAAALFV